MEHFDEGVFQSYLDRSLDPLLAGEIQAHLVECRPCSDRLRVLQEEAQFVAGHLKLLAPENSERPVDIGAARRKFEYFRMQKEQKTMWYQIFRGRSRAFQASLLLVMILAVSLVFPPVRAIANSFLGLFRVQQIAVVEVNPANLPEQLGSSATFEQLLAENIVYQEPASPERVDGLEAAAAAAGMIVRLPVSAEGPAEYWVQSGSQVEFMIDVDRLDLLLRELGLSDMELPAGIDGEMASLTVPSSVAVGYGECDLADHSNGPREADPVRQDDCTVLVQIPSPTIEAPPELDLPRLGSAFLQLMGMTAAEAEQFSRTVDWTTTLVIPIPRNGVQYETVQVDGVEGTLFRQDMDRHAPNYLLLWVRDGVVYALTGPGDGQAGVALANSIQ